MAHSGTTTESSKPPAHVRRGLPRPLLILLAVVVLGCIGFIVWRILNPPPNPHRLFSSGRLEGYETNLSAKIGARVKWIKYREGHEVRKGEILAQLNDEDYQAQLRGAQARIAKAQQAVKAQSDQIALVQAQMAGAQKRLGQAREQTTGQIAQSNADLRAAEDREKQAQADVAQAKSDLQLASIRLTRYTDLVKKGAVTKDEYDQAVTTFNNATATVNSRTANELAASKAVESARASLTQTLAARYTPPIRVTEVNVSQAQLDQAQKQLAEAQHDVANAVADRDQIIANIDYLTIRSPINGVVTARPVEPGAVMVPGQTILTVLDYSQVYMRAFIPEGNIASVKIGQPASVYLDAMPKSPLSGRVIEIDPQGSFTPENIYFKNDRVKQVFGIKIGIDNPGGAANPGMPADVWIDI